MPIGKPVFLREAFKGRVGGYASKLDPVDCAERRHCLSRSWRREMRGNILREEYYDLKRRIDATDVMSRLACFNHMKSTFAPVSDGYALASSVDRERILKEIREVSRHL